MLQERTRSYNYKNINLLTAKKQEGAKGQRRQALKGLSVSPELSSDARAPRDGAGFCRDEERPVAPRHRACLPVGQVFYYLGVPAMQNRGQNVHCIEGKGIL